MNYFERLNKAKTKRRIKIIDGEEYLKVSALKIFLNGINKRDIEVGEEYNDGWDGCIANISGEFDLMIGFGKSLTPELIRNSGASEKRGEKNDK